MNIILLEPDELDSEGLAVLRDRRFEHIRGVLAPQRGDRLRVGLINGRRGEAVVEGLDEAEVRLSCRFDQEPPPPPLVDLILAMPRPQTLKKVLFEGTSLGVRRFILIRARRTDPSYLQTRVLRDGNEQRLLREGLEQSGDTRLPQISVHRVFRRLIEDELAELCPSGALSLVAHPGVGARPMASLRPGDGPVVLAIGPEGGWIPFELDLLTAAGFQAVDMGPRILRVETAAIAAIAQLGVLRGLSVGGA